MQVRIYNKIEEKVNEYQERTGASKTWIAKQLGMTPQRMYQLMKSDNMMLDVIVRFAIFLECGVDQLIEYEKSD